MSMLTTIVLLSCNQTTFLLSAMWNKVFAKLLASYWHLKILRIKIRDYQKTLNIGALKIFWLYSIAIYWYTYMLNKNSLAVKKVRGQSEAANISDQKL